MQRQMQQSGVWIPYAFRTNIDLTWSEIAILADIASYKEYGKSRTTIAKQFKLTPTSVSNILHKLREQGFIEETTRYYNRRFYSATKKTKALTSETPKPFQELQTPTISHEEIIDTIQDIHRALGGQRPILITPQRVSKYKARTKTFKREEILQAAYNLSCSPFHMGKNDQRTKYATVDFLLRNDEQIEKWLYTQPQEDLIDHLKRSVF